MITGAHGATPVPSMLPRHTQETGWKTQPEPPASLLPLPALQWGPWEEKSHEQNRIQVVGEPG